LNKKENDMIELDGSTGEGGGQILRTSLALSMCTGQPFAVERIRAKRAKPGLMRQHLTCVQAATAVCGAKVQGAELGSQTLVFEPGAVQAGDYSFNVGTAGSCTLVLQTVLPALMLADATSRVVLSGGTHNPMAPPYHFLERSFVPLLRRLGVGIELELRRLGFYPAGGGEMSAVIQPPTNALRPFDLLSRGELRQSYAECLTPGLPRAVAQRELEAIGAELGWTSGQLRSLPARQNEGPGKALMATLEYESVTELFIGFGERGVTAERVARSVADEVRPFEASAGALGPHSADQWMLPLALAVHQAGGLARFSCNELTDHASTNMGVIERFLPVKWEAQRQENAWMLSVAGDVAALTD
jgi:RNA 3'-terminal phosphate cyclase (ATP)